MSTDLTVREYVFEQLEPYLPDDWKTEPGIPDKMSTLARPMLWLEYTAFQPLAEAPSKIAASVDVCVVTNKTDVRKGEADADEAVLELYEAALRSLVFYQITATKSVFWDAYFGWRLSITVIIQPPTTTPSEE